MISSCYWKKGWLSFKCCSVETVMSPCHIHSLHVKDKKVMRCKYGSGHRVWHIKIISFAGVSSVELSMLMRCTHTPSTAIPSPSISTRHFFHTSVSDVHRLSAKWATCSARRILLSFVATTVFFILLVWWRIWFSLWSRRNTQIILYPIVLSVTNDIFPLA